MKKSNLFLLVAAIILFVSLAIYNTNLRAEYLTGTYKDPYRNFKTLNFKEFDAIVINAGNGANVSLKQGDFQVRVREKATEYIKFKLVNQQLVLDVDYLNNAGYLNGQEHVVITLPFLKSLRFVTKLVDTPKEKNYTYYTIGSTIRVNGFNQDSLFIQHENLSRIDLTANKLAYLHAITGYNVGTGSLLHISKNNIIAQAHLDIRDKGELTIQNVFIPQLTYQFSDSAKVNLTGAALAILKK